LFKVYIYDIVIFVGVCTLCGSPVYVPKLSGYWVTANTRGSRLFYGTRAIYVGNSANTV